MSAMADVQRAIYARLSDDGPLTAAGFEVYDEPPNVGGESLRVQTSHIVIGDSTEAEGPGSHSERAWEGTETIHVWYRGRSTTKAKEAVEMVRDALEGERLEIEDNRTMLVRYEFASVIKEADWRHIPVIFRVVTGSRVVPVRPS